MTIEISRHVLAFLTCILIVITIGGWFAGLCWLMERQVCSRQWWWPVGYVTISLLALIWFITGAANG